jgi:hypothetical protein
MKRSISSGLRPESLMTCSAASVIICVAQRKTWGPFMVR